MTDYSPEKRRNATLEAIMAGYAVETVEDMLAEYPDLSGSQVLTLLRVQLADAEGVATAMDLRQGKQLPT